MTVKSTLLGAVALGLAISASAASAATLSVVGGASIALPANFSLTGDATYAAYQGGVGDVGDPLRLFDQASKSALNGLFLDGAGSLTFRFLGSEAGFENVAVVMGGTFVNNKVDAPGAVSASFAAGTGFLPFSFTSLGVNTVANDGVANADVRIAFSDVFNNGQSVLAYFDDTFPDIDYDDLVVRIDVVSEVPLPAAGWLFGAALLGAYTLSRKRSAA